MSKLLAALGLSTALAALSALPLAGVAQAAMAYGGIGADTLHRIAPVEKAQLVGCSYWWGGYCYCWYDDGWHGPGFYICGYAWNNGYGWGGPRGWRHWYGHGGPYYHHYGWGHGPYPHPYVHSGKPWHK